MTVRALETARWPTQTRVLAGTPVRLLAALAVAVGGVGAATAAGWVSPSALRVAGVAAAHGGLIAAALGWARGGRGAGLAPSLVIVVALAAAEAVTLADLRLSVAFLAVPLCLAAFRVAGHLDGLGLERPPRPGALLVGAVAGVVLGAHMVLASTATLGYRLRADGVAPYFAAVAYDVGANVPSGELFFRGALFNRLQRRWALAPAALVTTAAWVIRYLVDPRLPAAPEAVLGALVYLSVLGAANAWLFWWSGSLYPGLAASLAYFSAYRLLAVP